MLIKYIFNISERSFRTKKTVLNNTKLTKKAQDILTQSNKNLSTRIIGYSLLVIHAAAFLSESEGTMECFMFL